MEPPCCGRVGLFGSNPEGLQEEMEEGEKRDTFRPQGFDECVPLATLFPPSPPLDLDHEAKEAYTQRSRIRAVPKVTHRRAPMVFRRYWLGHLDPPCRICALDTERGSGMKTEESRLQQAISKRLNKSLGGESRGSVNNFSVIHIKPSRRSDH